MNVTSKFCQLKRVLKSCRNLHATQVVRNAYEGPGKTTVTFISKEIGSRLLITQCDEIGFTFNTGAQVIGPTMLFPRYAICWNIMSGKHINEASLSIFTILVPKPDLLIIGLDDQYDFPYLKTLQELVKKFNITTEIVSVRNACTIFNFVNEEGRYVVAGLIPKKAPKPLLKLPQSQPVKQINVNSDAETKSEKTETLTK